jgi:type I restriction enzyme S subunit
VAQAIFKSWFVDFEPWGGVMPGNWRVHRLGEFFPVVTGKMNANISSDKGLFPFFSCSQGIAWTDQYSFDGKAVLVAGNGDFNVKWYDGRFEAYQRTYVLMPYDGRLLAFLYYAIQDGLTKITSAFRGSVIRFITKGNIENHEMILPDNLVELPIIETLQNINEQIEHNNNESAHLTTLRDTLLPRLMSGELSVSDLCGIK